MGIFNQQPNYNQSSGKRGITGPQGPPGPPGPADTGFNITEGNYDLANKKLTSVAKGTASSDAVTKNQLDTAVGNKHGNDQNIDLKDTYDVINSKQQTFNEMNANRKTLVCYEDVRDVFVSRKESVFPMETHLDMGTNYIYNVKTPINNDQGVNKSYADTKLSLSGGLMTGNLDMNSDRIYNVAQPNGDNQPATKLWSENKFLEKSSGVMAGSLNTSNDKITHLATATANGDAVDFEFFNKYTPPGSRIRCNQFQVNNAALVGLVQIGYEYSSEAATIGWSNNKFLQRAGTNSMTGDLNMANNKIMNVGDATNNKDAVNLQTLNTYSNIQYKTNGSYQQICLCYESHKWSFTTD